MARLAQIAVDEVSLVDKAANLRKLLIVKNLSGQLPKELVEAGKVLDGLVESIKKGKGDGGHNDTPNYAQQAKDLLNAKVQEVASFFTSEERASIAKALGIEVNKVTPPPPPKSSDEDELTNEDVELIKQLESEINKVTSEVKVTQ